MTAACTIWRGTFHDGYPMHGKARVHRIAFAVDTTAPTLVDDGDTLTVDAERGAEA